MWLLLIRYGLRVYIAKSPEKLLQECRTTHRRVGDSPIQNDYSPVLQPESFNIRQNPVAIKANRNDFTRFYLWSQRPAMHNRGGDIIPFIINQTAFAGGRAYHLRHAIAVIKTYRQLFAFAPPLGHARDSG